MTLHDAVRVALARLERTLGELADRYPAALSRVGVGRGQIDDPFLQAFVTATAESIGAVEFRGERLAPRVFQRLREYVRGNPDRPIVPATVLELRSRDGRTNHQLARGTQVRPDPASVSAGEACAFRTTTGITVRPWQIGETEYTTTPVIGLPFAAACRSALRLVLRPTHPTVRKVPHRLRLYIAADDATAQQLLQAVFAHGCGAFASADGRTWKRIQTQPVGFAPASRLDQGGGLHSSALVREAIAFPRKHYFIDLLGIDLPPTASPALNIVLTFTLALPVLSSLRSGDLRLNCVPAVNLFAATPDGIRLEPGRTEYPVTLARLADGAELYSVDAVTEVGRTEPRSETIRRECPASTALAAIAPRCPARTNGT